jgi:hypothetical protein
MFYRGPGCIGRARVLGAGPGVGGGPGGTGVGADLGLWVLVGWGLCCGGVRHARVGCVLTGGLGGRNVSIRTPKVRKAAELPGLTWDQILAVSVQGSCFRSVCFGLG